MADGDNIYAVIKGAAINNDGSHKIGYTAPSVDGQASVISEALAIADIDPETITYVEAHGTGTVLGDPIEIKALQQAFQATTQKTGFCGLGSVKTNLGHLDAASGIAGLIKTALALKHKTLVPHLHFKQPNPQINFENSPFYINTKLCEWQTDGIPRRAGVSSFGIGGTNAHVVLEEAPAVQPTGQSRSWKLLVISAKTSTALDAATTNLAQHLKQNSELNLTDVAYTLQFGRKAFSHRRILLCQEAEDAIASLMTVDSKRVFNSVQDSNDHPVAFMFSGQGSQYVNMAQELYQFEPTFRDQIDDCAELLLPHLKLDLRHILYPSVDQIDKGSEQLKQTEITQPALFSIEYALAKLWMSWGIKPQALIGHSIGEYVAACLAGVFSLEDALALVAARGQMMQQLPGGAMIAVALPEADILPHLDDQLSLAVINGPSRCVVSGSTEAVDRLQQQLASEGIDCRHLHTSHAFHSHMMEPILASFRERVKAVRLQAPQIPFISNVTGTWITRTESTDPNYWVKHLRQTVRFADGLQQLLAEPEQILLEVGPGQVLSSLALQHPLKLSTQVVLSSLRHPKDKQSDMAFLLTTLAKLWLAGSQVDWSEFYGHEKRHRLPLPTYPFESQHYWIEELPKSARTPSLSQMPLTKKSDISDWFYIPGWKSSVILDQKLEHQTIPSCILVFIDNSGLGTQLINQLQLQGQDVITVKAGSSFAQLSDCEYSLEPGKRDDYDTLMNQIYAQNKCPQTIIHLWNVKPIVHSQSEFESVEKFKDLGFYSLLFSVQALKKQRGVEQLQIAVISSHT
ncbi:MAG: type I polyketide synthase, partial [Cyanobacteriota bacterium]|nr:type I polyketide synthase [Cyanobacteriota bacterium]